MPELLNRLRTRTPLFLFSLVLDSFRDHHHHQHHQPHHLIWLRQYPTSCCTEHSRIASFCLSHTHTHTTGRAYTPGEFSERTLAVSLGAGCLHETPVLNLPALFTLLKRLTSYDDGDGFVRGSSSPDRSFCPFLTHIGFIAVHAPRNASRHFHPPNPNEIVVLAIFLLLSMLLYCSFCRMHTITCRRDTHTQMKCDEMTLSPSSQQLDQNKKHTKTA